MSIKNTNSKIVFSNDFSFPPLQESIKRMKNLNEKISINSFVFFLIFNLCTIQCHSAMISYSVGSFSSNWLLMNFHSLHFPLLSLLFYYIYFFSFTLRMICGVMAKILYKRNSLTNKLKRTRNWILFNIFYHQKNENVCVKNLEIIISLFNNHFRKSFLSVHLFPLNMMMMTVIGYFLY